MRMIAIETIKYKSQQTIEQNCSTCFYDGERLINKICTHCCSGIHYPKILFTNWKSK
jgi:hypothetical protein